MKTKLTKRFWLALALFGLMGQIAWVVENMYLNVFMYKMFNASASDISAMVAASAIAATLTTVFVGALSDRIGKRKIFICGGYILWGLSIFAFSLLKVDLLEGLFPAVSGAALGITLTIVLDCVMTFFGSSANDAAFNAWLTDSTDASNRGSAEGINAMMPLVAILAVFGGFMAFDLNRSESWTMIFTIIGAATVIIGIIGIFIIGEKKMPPSESGYFSNVIYGFRPSTVKANPSFYFYLVAFIIFNISIQIFMPYLIIYYEVSLGMTDYVFVMAPAIIIASVVTALWGKVYDKKGFGFSSVFSIVWLIAGYIILYLTKTTAPVFIGSMLMMCGYLAGMAVFGANIRDLTPMDKAGRLQGVRIFSQVLVPGVVGPFIGKTVLANADKIVNSDGTESFVPNANIFLAALIPIIILALVLIVGSKLQKPTLKTDMTTPFEDGSHTDWTEYPRPQLKRDSYLSLTGKWELSVETRAGCQSLGEIMVPFPPESRLSGVCRQLKKGEKYVYNKTFSLPKDMIGKRVLLHFGAVDQIAKVYVNGKAVGEHTGGYLPFEFDITDALTPNENLISVEVTDNLDHDLAWGKQRKDRGGMWYTPISGIWKAVWVEAVPHNYIRSLKITPSLSSVTVAVEGGGDKKIMRLAPSGREYHFFGNSVTVDIDEPKLWTPESPYLYEFTVTDGTDTVSSYFALRTVTVEAVGNSSYICLNGKPYFCHGLLDQGYYCDGIYTPASPDALRYDIEKMKSLGFNMLRKHIKVEHELFYYYCDKLGMLVFQDMVNSGNYSFLIDTALPTAGFKTQFTHKANARRRQRFEQDSKETIALLYNHPSVIYYTIFNEGWGQFDEDKMYTMLKACDPSRIFDTTSGWFTKRLSDVTSEHVYFKSLNMESFPDRPLVLSEFGGYSCRIEGHCFNLDKSYGYTSRADAKAFEESFCSLYRDQVIPQIEKNGLCATVYTQVSDVEDETNGLLTYDRQVCKVDTNTVNSIAAEIQAAFEKRLR